MTISGDSGVLVAAPACPPSPYGLKSVADVLEQPFDQFGKGVEWDFVACGYDPGVVSGQCPALPESQTKVAQRGFDTASSGAFAVYAGFICNAMELGRAWDFADTLLTRNWWRAVERAFWTGQDQDGNPVDSSLGTADVTDLSASTGAVEITAGLAMLESFAADCFDCLPIIHGQRGIAPYIQERSHLETADGGKRFAATGTLFAPGGGYLSTGPSDESGDESGDPEDGTAWLYVTGAVNVLHTPTFFTPRKDDAAAAVDREINNVEVFAERGVAFQLGCCVGAVQVNLTSCCCSG
jgi:hypothetical protein